MASTELLAIGTGAARSEILVIAAGEQSTVTVKCEDGEQLDLSGGSATMRQLDDDGEFQPVGHSLGGGRLSMVIQGEGSYVFDRGPSDQAFGLFFNGGTLGGDS